MLTVEIKINNMKLGSIEIVRQKEFKGEDKVHNYSFIYDIKTGEQSAILRTGTITHKYSDGAGILIAGVLNTVYGLNKPQPMKLG